MNLKRLTTVLGLSALLVAFAVVMFAGTAPHSIVQARPTGTIVSGVITQSVTWNTAGSPYTIDGSLTVPNGLTLTIEPDVVVYLVNNGYHAGRLEINGALNAIGTPEQHPVYLRSRQRSDAVGRPGCQRRDSPYLPMPRCVTAALAMQLAAIHTIPQCACRTPAPYRWTRCIFIIIAR